MVVLASIINCLIYPFLALFFSNKDIALYKDLLYFCQALLPSTTALIIGWAVTGLIVNLVVLISLGFVVAITTMFLSYVVSQALWMTKIRELW